MSWLYDKRFDPKTAEGRDVGGDSVLVSPRWNPFSSTDSPGNARKRPTAAAKESTVPRRSRGAKEPLSQVNLPPDATALEQLQLNSAETQLRMGNQLLVTQMLDTFPLLFDVRVGGKYCTSGLWRWPKERNGNRR